MKRALIIFIALLGIFFAVWATKSKTPSMRPDSYAEGFSEDSGLWWNAEGGRIEVDENWILDPEIPENYLPVPGEDELYMVIDENGTIIGYRQRIKQEDGSWVWEDVNPDIPENYEAVEGLEDVYKVTYEDGSVKYFKYIRNEDGSFAFIEVDENGNIIDETLKTPETGDIPDNYVHLGNNVYAVLDEHGVVVGYKRRVDNKDGTFSWVDAEKPQNSNNGKNGSGPILSYGLNGKTNANSGEDYLANNKKPIPQISGSGKGTANQSPGGYVVSSGNGSGSGETTVTQNDQGYTETESYTTTETVGDYEVVYETKVIKSYDSKGKLLSTKKDGPNEISRKQKAQTYSNSADLSQVSGSLGEEVARISVGVSFESDLANNVLALLNAERAAQGAGALNMGGEAQQLAQARAAAMATYDYSDYNSPLYGTIDNMVAKYNVSAVGPSENSWKTMSDKDANAIHARFMSMDGSKFARMASEYTNIGIAIASKNGYYYICEVIY